MSISPMAGKRPEESLLINPSSLIEAYYTARPDPAVPSQRVSFGTSGHRGSSLVVSFNEDHVLAICQAICDYRKKRSIEGPLFLGKDPHALSEPAMKTALEVFTANGVEVRVQEKLGFTPTPVISHAILRYNRAPSANLADGVIVSPSHNPPEDGGIKYNPPHGGPAETEVTQEIEKRANELLGMKGRVKRTPFEKAITKRNVRQVDLIGPYVEELAEIVDLDTIKGAGLKIGVDPIGGATLPVWERIGERYGLDLVVINKEIDPRFPFVHLDHDGRIRMDCSSPYAMAGLIALRHRFDIAVANDPDGDRHGIVCPKGGLLNPNEYLTIAAWFLFNNRLGWKREAALAKTVVTTSMLDRVASYLGRDLIEVGVGFKWFVRGLLEGRYGFGGEESAGGSFLRKNGAVWTTDKDGVILGLLGAEIIAKTGRSLSEIYEEIGSRVGRSFYQRIDRPIGQGEKKLLASLNASCVNRKELAGEEILEVLDRARGDGAPIGGIKVVTRNGWFAARPSGTEDIYKLYAESFLGEGHLYRIQQEAQAILSEALRSIQKEMP